MGPDPPPRSLPAPPGAGGAPLKLSLPPKAGAGLRAVERQIWESRRTLEEDVQALSELLARLGEHPRPGPDPLRPWSTSGASVSPGPREDLLLALVYTGLPIPSRKRL